MAGNCECLGKDYVIKNLLGILYYNYGNGRKYTLGAIPPRPLKPAIHGWEKKTLEM
jgi:hypothetical protein